MKQAKTTKITNYSTQFVCLFRWGAGIRSLTDSLPRTYPSRDRPKWGPRGLALRASKVRVGSSIHACVGQVFTAFTLPHSGNLLG